MNAAEFRKELVKIMPGYKWTVHKPAYELATYLDATGIQSSGSNRLSTLSVTRRERDATVEYEVKSAGHGTHSVWLNTAKATTVAQALRALQDHYEHMAQKYDNHACALQKGRCADQAK